MTHDNPPSQVPTLQVSDATAASSAGLGAGRSSANASERISGRPINAPPPFGRVQPERLKPPQRIDQVSDADIEVIPLRNAVASDIVQLVQRLFRRRKPAAPAQEVVA